MMLFSRTAIVCILATALGACNGTTATPDGGDTGVVPDAAPADVRPDTGPPLLFNKCSSDADCPTGGTCLLNTTGWPGGLCSQNCDQDGDCLPNAPNAVSPVCRTLPGTRQKVCLRECLNGFDCGRGGWSGGMVCVLPTSGTATTGICQPSCNTMTCGDGAVCNEYTGLCQATSITYPPAGQDIGQACTVSGASSECRTKQCIPESASDGRRTGWNGGECIGSCILTTGWTSASLYGLSDTFPQSNCPTHSLCFPSTGSTAEADPGTCLRECTADTDCRTGEGYYCHKTFTLTRLHPDHTTYGVPHTWNNGYCDIIDCVNDTSHPCPGGYFCESQTRGTAPNTFTVGVCRINSSVDAGPEAGTDAATTPEAGNDAGTPDVGVTNDVVLPDADVDAGLDEIDS